MRGQLTWKLRRSRCIAAGHASRSRVTTGDTANGNRTYEYRARRTYPIQARTRQRNWVQVSAFQRVSGMEPSTVARRSKSSAMFVTSARGAHAGTPQR
jgi:hypothetical protein